MSGGGKVFMYFGGFFLFMVMLKDGTIPTIVNDGAAFVRDTAKGIRPITRVG